MAGARARFHPRHVTLLGSGAILTEVVKAAELLAAQGVDVSVLSVTSWSELARDGVACAARAGGRGRAWRALGSPATAGTRGPVIAATDYVRAVPESVRAFVPRAAATSRWAPTALGAAIRGRHAGARWGGCGPDRHAPHSHLTYAHPAGTAPG
jgi:pyruvate dehydrogenase complex dehydrogenase (E1) component